MIPSCCDPFLADQYQKYIDQMNWTGALYTLNRLDRPQVLQSLIDQHGVERLFDAINHIWTDAENAWENEHIWSDIWFKVTFVWDRKARTLKFRKRRRIVMDRQEREFFNALPNILSIHRGFNQEGGWRGWSWTLDRSRAEWFARRFPGVPMVATMELPKHKALAYFSGRQEAEIVVNIDDLDENPVIDALLPIEQAA